MSFFKKIVVFILIIAISGITYSIWQNNGDNDQYKTIEVAKGNIEYLVTSQGKLEPKDYVDVGARVSGELKKLYVKPGDKVKKGQLLAEIDAELFEEEVKADEARLKTLEAQLLESKAILSQRNLANERNKKLIKSGAISQEDFEQSQTDLKVASTRLASIKAQIEEAKSSLSSKKTNLNYTKIYSPMDGTVASQEAREGETLNANQTTPTIVSISNLELMNVRAQVGEADISKIKVGMHAYFSVFGSEERRWHGKVEQILPVPEEINNVVLYNVIMGVKNKDGTLLPDMSSKTFFVVERAKDVAVIPTHALLNRQPEKDKGKMKAYSVLTPKNNSVEERTIYVGIKTRSKVQILQGLEPGNQVVIPESAELLTGSK